MPKGKGSRISSSRWSCAEGMGGAISGQLGVGGDLSIILVSGEFI